MKVGTDGVLLGAWVNVEPADRRILDIGTGTGLIALMLAQRSNARIVALDIDENCASQAAENFAASPWRDRLQSIHTPVQTYDPGWRFDLIVSNPPYFTESLKSPDPGKNTARHTVSLTFSDLTAAVQRLLHPAGRFALVLPPAEMQRFRSVALGRLFPVRRTEVYPGVDEPVKRILAEFSPIPAPSPTPDRLTIDEHDAHYRRLLEDFYLKF